MSSCSVITSCSNAGTKPMILWTCNNHNLHLVLQTVSHKETLSSLGKLYGIHIEQPMHKDQRYKCAKCDILSAIECDICACWCIVVPTRRSRTRSTCTLSCRFLKAYHSIGFVVNHALQQSQCQCKRGQNWTSLRLRLRTAMDMHWSAYRWHCCSLQAYVCSGRN